VPPIVVGILALTTQLTSGSFFKSLGFFCPQPPLDTLLSTGIDLGTCWAAEGCDGVCMPGVEGGVKAGDTSPGSVANSCSDGGEESVFT
jgi:hypothetical protein